MTGPDSFFADDDASINQMMLLKMQIADLEGNCQALKEENATLRTTAQSLCKWYEGQEGLREALETLMLDCRTGNADISDTTGHAIRAALSNHNAATPLWRPLLDCMEKSDG